jgi:glycosyltransferase involved in cell wall biosynthesis
MRVLMVSKACLVGTYQTKLEQIAQFADIDLTVVVPPYWRENGRVTQLDLAYTRGYRTVVEPIAFNGSFHLHFYPRLGQRILAFAPDVVHIDEEPYNFATYHALRLSRRAGARSVWFTWQNLNRAYPLPFRLIERYNLSHVDYAIAGTTGAETVWREKGYVGPLAVIPQFGVAPEVFKPGPARDSARSFLVGYVGRLVEEKGVDLLLRAVAALQGPWQLVVAGAGPERSSLVALARQLGLADRVSFEAHIPNTRMPAFYQGLDALVLPSRSRPNWIEQFGRVLIEAMASGVPVVGSDCGAIPAVVQDAGLIFPEGDVTALAECLRRLVHDPALWADLARRGRERALTEYSQAHIAAQTVAVYREMVGASR